MIESKADALIVDVLIVGAGPTGLTAAAALRQRGIAPLIVDAHADFANTSRAAVIHARTMEVLEEIGVTDTLIEQGVKVPIFRIRDRDRTLLEIDFHTLPSRYNYTLMCPQDRTEAILRDRLTALGGSVERGCRATALRIEDDGVLVTLDDKGEERQIRARYVIGADGGHSIVREQAGIAFEGGSYAESFVLADVHMDWPLSEEEVSLFFSPKGLVVVAPLPGGRHRVVATVDNAPEAPGVAYVQALLDARGPETRTTTVRDVVWSSRFTVHHRVAGTFRKGPALLAGDAAHVHSPAGGQGMNTGIQDALELAAALGETLRGGDGAALDRYAEHRREVAGRVVGMTDKLTRAATLRNPIGQQVRNAALTLLGHIPPAKRAIAENLAELHNA